MLRLTALNLLLILAPLIIVFTWRALRPQAASGPVHWDRLILLGLLLAGAALVTYNLARPKGPDAGDLVWIPATTGPDGETIPGRFITADTDEASRAEGDTP